MFDYSIQILQEGKKSKLIMTIDQEIVLEKPYNTYVAASEAAAERIMEEHRKRGQRND